MVRRRFQGGPGGRKQRQGSGDWEQATNRQQRRLTRAFDSWSAGARRKLAQAASRGASAAEQVTIFEASLPELEAALTRIVENGVRMAGRMAAEGRFDLPGIQRLVDSQTREEVERIRDAVIPTIRDKLLPDVARGLAREPKAIRESFLLMRAGPPALAGGFWVMIFATKQRLGQVREMDRISQGLLVEPVRWVIDPRAAHCEPSAGHHGCPELAGEYPGGWSTLPTVPAGLTTCRGNCRCHIEVYRDGAWHRGVFED